MRGLLLAIGRYADGEEASDIVVRFFERLAVYQVMPDNVSRYRRTDWDNYKFLANELFLCLIAVLIKLERFEFIGRILSAPFYQPGRHGSQGTVETFCIFAGFIDSLEHRNQRLKLGRVSLKADMLNERRAGSTVSFQELIQADTVLFVRSKFDEMDGKDTRGRWYPHTSVFASNFGAFELFVRATSVKFFEKLRPIFDNCTASEFKEKLRRIGSLNSGFDRVSIEELCNGDKIASR